MTHLRFVSDHAEEYGVKWVCRVLEVSRSGYYDWKRRPESGHATRDAELGTLIAEIHQRSRTTYGAPRCTPSFAASTIGVIGSGWPASCGPRAW